MAPGDTSQTTPVHTMHDFMLCCSTQIAVCSILIPVRVLIVIILWCVLIDNKVNNLINEF